MKESKSENKIVCPEYGCGSMDLKDITTDSHSKKEFQCNSCSSQFQISYQDFLDTKYGEVEEFCQSVNNFEFKITNGFINSTENVLIFFADAKRIAGENYNKVKKFVTNENLCHLILSK